MRNLSSTIIMRFVRTIFVHYCTHWNFSILLLIFDHHTSRSLEIETVNRKQLEEFSEIISTYLQCPRKIRWVNLCFGCHRQTLWFSLGFWQRWRGVCYLQWWLGCHTNGLRNHCFLVLLRCKLLHIRRCVERSSYEKWRANIGLVQSRNRLSLSRTHCTYAKCDYLDRPSAINIVNMIDLFILNGWSKSCQFRLLGILFCLYISFLSKYEKLPYFLRLGCDKSKGKWV